jgi:hypothetical protein
MDNPFHYGELVSGAYFTNRTEELAHQAACLTHHRHRGEGR